ncbi:hypothetical protein GJ496_003435 [Pomphorhynchus laevis]|nr:hypothetical protein GJ496_003435 [Pomphorhynchus laevis]
MIYSGVRKSEKSDLSLFMTNFELVSKDENANWKRLNSSMIIIDYLYNMQILILRLLKSKYQVAFITCKFGYCKYWGLVSQQIMQLKQTDFTDLGSQAPDTGMAQGRMGEEAKKSW